MTPEHRATLTRLLALIEAHDFSTDEARACAPALRAVLAVPEAVEGGAWESAEAFAVRYVCDHAMPQCDRHIIVRPIVERDAQTADRLESIFGAPGGIVETRAALRTFVRDLRGLPR